VLRTISDRKEDKEKDKVITSQHDRTISLHNNLVLIIALILANFRSLKLLQ